MTLILQTSSFSTGFAYGHYKYTSAESSASVSLVIQFELVCDSDDPRNTVLMMPSLTFFRRRRLRKR